MSLLSAMLNQRVEDKLRVSELRYRRLFETAQDGILILDGEEGRIVDVNPFLREMLGYSLDELLGKKLWEIGVFKDVVDSKAAFNELQNSGYVRYEDLPLETKSGEKVDVEFVSNVYMVGKDKVIQCNIRDVSSRKRAEDVVKLRTKELEGLGEEYKMTRKAMLNVVEDLEEAKAKIEVERAKDEAMFASIGEGLIAVDNNRRVVNVNTAAALMLGWKVKDLLGKVITSLRLEDESGKEIPLKKRPTFLALTTNKVTNATYFFVRKDKTRFPIVINVTPIKLGGKIIGAIDTFRDISKELEVDKAKSEFVSLASHQLRTPLGITKWYLEALMRESYMAKSPEVVQVYVREISKSNERLLSLVRDLLSVSRIDQGRVKNAPKKVDVVGGVKEVVEQMRVVADKKKVSLKTEMEGLKTQLVNIDPLRFHEVIENLVGNAIIYTASGGKVSVRVTKSKSDVLISVKDTGMGISESDQKKLFSKFFRSEKAVGFNPEGSGLGLYVVKSYVEGWGGEIEVVSREDKGSVFTVKLPILGGESKKGGKVK